MTPAIHLQSALPRRLRWLPGLSCAALLAACTEPPPQRVLTGNLTDPRGAPLPDAAVTLNGEVALTGQDGSFRLTGIDPEPGDLLTATAAGFTAWSLPLEEPRAFTVRLIPRPHPTAATSATLDITLALPRPAEVDRTLFLSLGNGQLLPVYLYVGNAEVTLTVPAPGEGFALSAISPAPGPFERAFAAPPQQAPPQGALRLALEEVPGQTLTATLRNRPQGDDAPPLDLAVACSRQGSTFLAGRLHLDAPFPPDADVPLLLDTRGATCDLVATLDLDAGRGDARHVAFSSNHDGDALSEQPIPLDLPDLLPLAPRLSGRTLTWTPHPQATLYDVYIAPDDGDRVGAPLWSATTDRAELTLPELPAPARQRLDFDAARPHLVRIVARLAPGFDLQGAWDWSAYHAYVASPWTEVPYSTLAPWRPHPEDSP